MSCSAVSKHTWYEAQAAPYLNGGLGLSGSGMLLLSLLMSVEFAKLKYTMFGAGACSRSRAAAGSDAGARALACVAVTEQWNKSVPACFATCRR